MLAKTTLAFSTFILCVVCEPESLLGLLKSNGLTQMANYVDKAGFSDLLDKKGPFTLFAPSNAAFEYLPAAVLQQMNSNKTFLQRVIMYHVVKGPDLHPTSNFTNEEKLKVLLSNLEVRINVYDIRTHINPTCTVNGARVTYQHDLKATNGILHGIDTVLYQISIDTVYTWAAKNPSFKNFTSAIKLANLQPILADSKSGPWTIFAPTDTGFAKMTSAQRVALFDNSTALKEMLQFNMIKGTLYSEGYRVGVVEFDAVLPDHEIYIYKDSFGGISLQYTDYYPFKTWDIPVNNGVVYVLDDVLIPKKTLSLA